MGKTECELKDLPFDEFVKLKNFLDTKIDCPKDEDGHQDKLAAAMLRFFPGISIGGEFYIVDLAKDMSESVYSSFQKEFPNEKVDLTGCSNPAEHKAWELELETIQYVYCTAIAEMDAGTDKSRDRQIVKANDPSFLKDIKPIETYTYITLAKKRYPMDTWTNKLDFIQDHLKDKFGSDVFLGKVFSYCYGKQRRCYIDFLGNTVSRLECMFFDKNLENPENKRYYEIVKELSA
jgi:hypothetical protein